MATKDGTSTMHLDVASSAGPHWAFGDVMIGTAGTENSLYGIRNLAIKTLMCLWENSGSSYPCISLSGNRWLDWVVPHTPIFVKQVLLSLNRFFFWFSSTRKNTGWVDAVNSNANTNTRYNLRGVTDRLNLRALNFNQYLNQSSLNQYLLSFVSGAQCWKFRLHQAIHRIMLTVTRAMAGIDPDAGFSRPGSGSSHQSWTVADMHSHPALTGSAPETFTISSWSVHISSVVSQ